MLMDKPANKRFCIPPHNRYPIQQLTCVALHSAVAGCKAEYEAQRLQKMKSLAQVQLSGPTAEANVRAVLACFEALLPCVCLPTVSAEYN